MSESLDALIERIKDRANDDDSIALKEALQLAEQHPGEMKVWFALAYVHGRNGNFDDAVASMTRALEIGPRQPALYFHRGDFELERGNLQAALADFTEGIASSNDLQRSHYLKTLYFFRADVLLRLGRKAEARADLAHLPDNFSTWTTTLRTKQELLAQCDH